MRNLRATSLFAGILAIVFTSFLVAQEKSGQAERRAFLLDTFVGYQIGIDGRDNGQKAIELNRKPLHFFSNPISGVVDAGVFIWEQNGYPHAIGKIFINEKKQAWGEYISTLSNSGLRMQGQDSALWRPDATKFQRLGDFVRPSRNANARKVQMRSIASQFSVLDLWKEDGLISDKAGTDWSLRMLAKPLHRYESKQFNVIDGGIFGFVQGTNPEAILTIEAIEDGGESHWQYRFSRLTIYELKAKRKNKLVWSVPRSFGGKFSYHGWHPFTVYPFDKADAPLTLNGKP